MKPTAKGEKKQFLSLTLMGGLGEGAARPNVGTAAVFGEATRSTCDPGSRTGDERVVDATAGGKFDATTVARDGEGRFGEARRGGTMPRGNAPPRRLSTRQ